ncbi:putative F-box protein At3g23950 [Castanea sativa]|uniref:putative F-box protein At3g23950 n=1 Tax=Castanea sativa TaxID=21020 RepID=UPI003F651F45
MAVDFVPLVSLSTCASRIEELPDDVLFEIIYRLPCRSAILCMSLSKHWLSLISHPYFILGFINHRYQIGKHYYSSEPFTFLLQHYDKFMVFPSDINSSSESFIKDFGLSGSVVDFLKFLPLGRYNKLCIEASFNDLLLVCNEVLQCCKSDGDYYICNPLTKQWLTVPLPPPVMSSFNRPMLVGFICGPYKECITNANYRYKVVRIHSLTESDKTTQLRMEIFSSETNEWCNSFVESPRELYRFSFMSKRLGVVACNGMLHWADVDSVNGMTKGFVVFDPQQCHLHYIDPPILPIECFISFGVFQGHLRLFYNPIYRSPDCRLKYCDCENNASNISVWELVDYDNAGGTWSLKHTVCYKGIISECSTFFDKKVEEEEEEELQGPVKFIAFHQNDGDIVFLQFSNYIVSCNLRTRVCALAATVSMRVSSIFLLGQPSWPTPIHRSTPIEV